MKLFWYGVIMLWFVLVFTILLTANSAEGIYRG